MTLNRSIMIRSILRVVRRVAVVVAQAFAKARDRIVEGFGHLVMPRSLKRHIGSHNRALADTRTVMADALKYHRLPKVRL